MSDVPASGEPQPSADAASGRTGPEPARPRTSPLFRLLIPVSVVFVLTVLLLLASAFRSGPSPVFDLLNRFAVPVLGVEVCLVLGLGLAAMIDDGRRTKADTGRGEAEQES